MNATFASTLALATLAAGLIEAGSIIYPKPVMAAKPRLEPISTQLKSTNNDAFYNQAQADLEEDYYILYRIVERLARANGLDQHPWRVRLSPEYEVNAFASELNTLTFMSGILDQLHGDNAAIACVVGHEMAHHTKGHIPTRVEVEAQLDELMAEAEAEAVAEITSAQQQSAINNTVGNILGNVLGSVIGGSTGAVVEGTTQEIVGSMSEAQRQQTEVRTTQIYAEKVAALEAQFSDTLKSQEYEADEYGYQYMVRAGFDPQGCLRVMNVLGQTETSRLASFSHPNPSDRIRRLNAQNTQATAAALEAEGRVNLTRSPEPLKYDTSRDGVSLRIESRYGTSGSGFPE
ncbi:MAG: M48 family metalloprotease [Leptolyngbyaceae cyanobacterium SM2_3_12]|nr:M48 family metalloprotease [Leptolyngbyaceae cyanobacterium SM2_3_12]